MTTYSAALTEGIKIGGPFSAGRYRTASIVEGLAINDYNGGGSLYFQTMVEGLQLGPTTYPGYNVLWGLSVTHGLAINDVVTYKIKPGGAIVSGMAINDVVTATVKYHMALIESVSINTRANGNYLAKLTEGLGIGGVLKATPLASIVEGLRLNSKAAAQAMYHISRVEGILLNDVLFRGLGANIVEGLRINSALVPQYIGRGVIREGLGLGGVAVAQRRFNPALIEGLGLGDLLTPKMIYKGDPIVEGLNIYLLYAEPSGSSTVWAMNTRTGALTEYKNWNFNSFAWMSRKYLGANQQGLFELNGAQDNGVNTIADVAGGFLELADGKLAGLKGIYLGISGQGTYMLKLVAGDGRDYIYQFVSQPNLMTTKVIVGKGLRSRYLRWELISTGADFDLDSIEFVPMVGARRV